MARVQQRDQSLWQKRKDFFRELAQKLKEAADAYRGKAPDSVEGRLVSQLDEAYERLQAAFMEALQDAGKNYQETNGQKNTTREGGSSYEYALMRSDRIVDQIRKSIDKIMDIDSVFTIDEKNATNYMGIRKTDKKAGYEVFKYQGGYANRPGYGKIVLGIKRN